MEPASQLEPSESNASSGVKRDACAAELLDEDEQGGKFQQVEAVDAEEIPCEFSVEDDFEVDKTAEGGVDEEIVKAILVGKKKELDAMGAFGIFDVREELPKDAKISTTRWENVPKGDKWRCMFVTRDFKRDPEMEGLYTSGSTAATGGLVHMHAAQHGYSVLCLDAENAYFHAEEDEEVYRWLAKEWVNRYHARGGRVWNPWWKLKRQLHGRRKSAKKFNEFVVSAALGLGLAQCLEQPSLCRRPGTTLIFELHQDDFYVSGSNVELAWLQEHLGARFKLKLAEPMGPGSAVQLHPSDENEGGR